MKKLFDLYKKHEEGINYLFFGGLTVIINTAVFMIFPENIQGLSKETAVFIANTVSFVVAVMFAYFTNTWFVFKTSCSKRNFFGFMSMRIMSLVVDNLGMVFLIHVGTNKFIAKIVMNVIVIIINYLASKFWVFRNKR